MLNGKFISGGKQINTFTVKREFIAKKPSVAELKITALGLYFAKINGVRVGDRFLTPGWTEYNKMLQVQSYDISGLVVDGCNVIEITVNEGWYAGPIAFFGKKNIYGDTPAACADIYIDGELCVATDNGWTCTASYIVSSGIYAGETWDTTRTASELATIVVEFDKSLLVEQMCEPVRTVERLSVKRTLKTPSGDVVYDFGQNISGVVEIETTADFDGTLTVRFAEILVDGEFYTENLRGAKATDTLTAKGKVVFAPEFTFHGFRYVKIDGAVVPPKNVTALVRHTDLVRTGSITTSDARMERLIDNVFWGQRDNFVDIPSDCPQRDERLGWTADINVFCRTAAYNYDIRRFMRKWLADLRNCQTETGELPLVAPDAFGFKRTDAVWCDAITMVPWTLYEMYGDKSFLSENLDAMLAFLSACRKNAENGLIVKGLQHGDWLAIDTESLIGGHGRTDKYYIANVFYAVSVDIAAKSARILGNAELARRLKKEYRRQIDAVRREYFTRSGRLALDTVTAQVLALHFGIVEKKHRAKLASTLNDNVIAHKYRVSTGFVGTPYLLFALADNGYIQTAHKVLTNSEFPGWLYEVDNGATTVWERWDSVMPDGSVNPDAGMNSFNHYAYGSVLEFVYRRVAGIDTGSVGFKTVNVSPMPIEGINSLSATYNSVSGKITSAYEVKADCTEYRISIPDNIKAHICLPDGSVYDVTGGEHKYSVK